MNTFLIIGAFITSFIRLYAYPVMEDTKVSAQTPSLATSVVSERVRLRYYDFLTGGGLIHKDDEDIAAKIRELDAFTEDCRGRMNKSPSRRFIWDDRQWTEADSHPMTQTYIRLSTMAIAYCTEGSRYRGDKALRDDIICAMDFMSRNRYSVSAVSTGNWWDWMIGSPLEINRILTLLYDEMPSTLVTAYTAALKAKLFPPFSGATRMSVNDEPGDANIIWINFNRLMGCVLENNDDAVIATANHINDFWFNNISGSQKNGFYPDGSYILHNVFPYVGSYGAAAIQTAAYYVYVLEGTPCQVSNQNLDMLMDWIRKAFAPFIYEGLMMDMVRGRAIARETEGDHLIGHTVIRSCFLISQCIVPEAANELQRLLKYWIGMDRHRNIYVGTNTINNNNSVYFIDRIKAMMEDDGIHPADEPSGHFQFPAMDRTVHLRPGYGLGLSLHSSAGRICNYECINGDNIKGWHTADGMMYLYNRDAGQFSDNYWATVDKYRLPGTTAITNLTLNDCQFPHTHNGDSWVGGSHIGNSGIAGMYLKPGGRTLSAKKSWFMFEDEIVCIGSDITATDNEQGAGGDSSSNEALPVQSVQKGHFVETVVENRKIKADNGNILTVDGRQALSAPGETVTLTDVAWIHLSGNNDADVGIGYYFPTKSTIYGVRKEMTGRWSDVCTNAVLQYDTLVHKANYVTLAVHHGANPAGGHYSYVLLPDKNSAQTQAYSSAPDITILENSSDAHAVTKNSRHITCVNFWNDKPYQVGFIHSDKKASVMVKETGLIVEVAVSDPTQANTGIITLLLEGKNVGQIISCDSNVTVIQTNPLIINVYVGGNKGACARMSFSMLN